MYHHLSNNERAEAEREQISYEMSSSESHDAIDEHDVHHEIFQGEMSDEASDLGDLFEGEIDSDIFAPADDEEPDVSAAWAALRDIRNQENNSSTALPLTRLQSDCPAVASGGLGNGDIPYDELTFRVDQRDNYPRPSTPELGNASSKSESPLHLSPVRRAREALHQTYGSELGYEAAAITDGTPKLKHIRKHDVNQPLDMPWDRFQRPVNNEVYSPSVSSETLSDWRDDSQSQLRIDACQTPERELRTESKILAAYETETPNSEEEQLNKATPSSTLLQKRPYLSEVAPAISQSRHPSLIPRSPHRDALRTSSLSAGSLQDMAFLEGAQLPATALAPSGRHAEPSDEVATSEARTDSPAAQVWQQSQFLDNNWNSFRPSIASSASSSSNGNVPMRSPVDSTTVEELSTHPQSLAPSRPDTPRPFAENQPFIASECSQTQSLDTTITSPRLKEETTSSKVTLDVKPPGFARRVTKIHHNETETHHVRPEGKILHTLDRSSYDSFSAASAPPHLGPAAVTFSLSGQPVQYAYASQSVPGVILQYEDHVMQPQLRALSLSNLTTPVQHNLVQLDESWQEPPQVQDQLAIQPSRSQNTERSKPTQASKDSSVSTSSSIGLSQVASQEEFVQILKRPSDPSAANKDEILFPTSLVNDSPPLSPLSGLQDVIYQAKRGSRIATSSKRKPTRNITNTRGRAVSISPKKKKPATVATSTPAAAGVQDGNAKIGKKKTAQGTRRISRKAVVQRDTKDDEMIPDVPPLPDDMEIDAPEAQPRFIGVDKRQSKNSKKKTPTKRAVRGRKATPTTMPAKTRKRNAQRPDIMSPEGLSTTSHPEISTTNAINPHNRVVPDTPLPINQNQATELTTVTSPMLAAARAQIAEDLIMDCESPTPKPDLSTDEVLQESSRRTPMKSSVKRRALPGPRRFDWNRNKAESLPKTPEPKERPAVASSGLTNVSTPESGIKKMPLRSSPRLRGEAPGPGL